MTDETPTAGGLSIASPAKPQGGISGLGKRIGDLIRSSPGSTLAPALVAACDRLRRGMEERSLPASHVAKESGASAMILSRIADGGPAERRLAGISESDLVDAIIAATPAVLPSVIFDPKARIFRADINAGPNLNALPKAKGERAAIQYDASYEEIMSFLSSKIGLRNFDAAVKLDPAEPLKADYLNRLGVKYSRPEYRMTWHDAGDEVETRDAAAAYAMLAHRIRMSASAATAWANIRRLVQKQGDVSGTMSVETNRIIATGPYASALRGSHAIVDSAGLILEIVAYDLAIAKTAGRLTFDEMDLRKAANEPSLIKAASSKIIAAMKSEGEYRCHPREALLLTLAHCHIVEGVGEDA